jgi:GntR family negative regulator for fad regulon and positive regulator of fabA
MTDWLPPQRPMVYAEQALVNAILDGIFPPGSTLPGERDLAVRLGVTRPTLREALQRLGRDGWLTIRQGKSTYVNDFWREGGLSVLNALVRCGQHLPRDFVPHLLEVRLALAPAFIEAAVTRSAASVAAFLADHASLEDTSEAFAAFDWKLHRTLAFASGNPVYTLIVNGFAGFYEEMARRYFALPEARNASRAFYAGIYAAAQVGDAAEAGRLSRAVLQETIALWWREPEHRSVS